MSTAAQMQLMRVIPVGAQQLLNVPYAIKATEVFIGHIPSL
jgi:hypothetical protein